MNAIIVDASVGMKWFIPEVHSGEANQWRHPSNDLHTLAVFFDIEIANILWKKVQKSELSSADAVQILAQLPSLPVTRHSEADLLAFAFETAHQIQRTVYDSLYLALAVQLGGQMVTADQRLYNSVTATTLANHIVWVANVPTPP